MLQYNQCVEKDDYIYKAYTVYPKYRFVELKIVLFFKNYENCLGLSYYLVIRRLFAILILCNIQNDQAGREIAQRHLYSIRKINPDPDVISAMYN